MAITIDQLNIELTANSQKASSAIDKLAKNLETLKATLGPLVNVNIKVSNSFKVLDNSIKTASSSTSQAKNAFDKLTETIKKQEKRLETLKSEYASYVLTNQQSSQAAQNLSKRIEYVVSDLSRNKERLEKAKIAADSFTNSNKKLSTSAEKVATSTNKASISFGSFAQRMAQKISTTRTLVSVFQNMANKFADWFNESNEYIETLNLFNVTMGESAEEARNFAESLSGLMGIDPKEWMQYQGIFKNLTAGFGVATKDANKMSQNLTQLAYDMASFFNPTEGVVESFEKLSSAMSGQVKGLREYGIDTTVATLQEYALSRGIDASVRSMSQAEKALLRYNYIMEQSRDLGIWNDMARTIATPANALRILNAQLTQMKRALGNIVSVIVVQFIPYVQAMVQIITEAANAIAKFFGFSEKDFEADVPKTDDIFGLEDAEESLDGVSGSIKKIKKQLMGFDELNIINNPDTDSGGSGGASGSGVGLNMDLLEYDFLKGLNTSKVDEIKDKLKEALKIAGAIGTAISAWKISQNFANALNTLTTLMSSNPGTIIALGAVLTITGFSLEFSGIKDAIQNGLGGLNFTEILVGGLLGTGGAALLGSSLVTLIGKIGSEKLVFAMASLGQKLGFATTAGMGAAIGASVGAIIAGIPMYFVGIYDAIMNGLNWLNGLLIPAGATLAGAGIGAVIGMLGGPIGAGIGALIGLAVGALTDLGILIYEKWDEISAWTDTHIVQPMKTFFKPLTDACKTAWTWLEENLFTPFKNAWNEVKTYATEKFTEIKNGVVTAFTTIRDKVVEIVNKIKEIFTALKWAFNEYVWKPIKEKVTAFYNEYIKPVVDAVKNAAKTIWNAFKEMVLDKIKQKIDGLVADFKAFGTGVVNFISGLFKGVINGILGSIEDKINRFIRLLNGAIGIINKIPGVNITKVTEISIPRLAEGGVVGEGQMFIAREAGPELVGTIGNKTAVANNDQIISGIESGVYRAMMAANSNKGGSQTIRIINEIDGDVVGEKVIQYHNGRVMQTGTSPLLV